jgi:hypothetical protein
MQKKLYALLQCADWDDFAQKEWNYLAEAQAQFEAEGITVVPFWEARLPVGQLVPQNLFFDVTLGETTFRVTRVQNSEDLKMVCLQPDKVNFSCKPTVCWESGLDTPELIHLVKKHIKYVKGEYGTLSPVTFAWCNDETMTQWFDKTLTRIFLERQTAVELTRFFESLAGECQVCFKVVLKDPDASGPTRNFVALGWKLVDNVVTIDVHVFFRVNRAPNYRFKRTKSFVGSYDDAQAFILSFCTRLAASL